MFRISRYALAHSFVQKYRTNSYQLILNTYLALKKSASSFAITN